MPLSFYYNYNYNSVSEDSLNRLLYEPIQYSDYPRRRLSASDLQEILCAQGEQIHIDPRYRDTRPIARSNSLVYVFEDVSPTRGRLDLCNPPIFIEEYNDNAEPVVVDYQADNQYTDPTAMRRSSMVSQANQPLNEDGIASVADSEEEIPFIDDEFEPDVEAYVPGHQSRPSKSGIMVSSSASERRTSSACRKTVSFDLVENESSRRNSSSLDRENANLSRKSSTFDAISDFYDYVNQESNDNYASTLTCLPKVQIFDEHDLELEVECPSPAHRQLNPERSTSPRTKQRRRSMSNVPVPLRKFSSSSEVSMMPMNMRPPAKNCSYNSFNLPSIVIEGPPAAATTVKQFGEGKVRELTVFFESQSLPSQCFPSKFISKSTPNLCAVDKLNEEEQCKVLKQLNEWGTHGTSGKDYILDFSRPSKPSHCHFETSQKHFNDQCTSQSLPYCYRSDSCLACSSCCCSCRHRRRCHDFDYCCPITKNQIQYPTTSCGLRLTEYALPLCTYKQSIAECSFFICFTSYFFSCASICLLWSGLHASCRKSY